MFFFISLYMQQVLGYSALKAGLSYLPLAGGIIISAGPRAGLIDPLRLQAGADRGPVADRGRADLVLPGLAGRQLRLRHPVPVAAGGDRPRPRVRADDGRRGVGVETHEAGLASGLINTSQQVGGALGLADPGLDRQQPHRRRGRRRQPDAVALTEGFQRAFMVGAGFAILGAILATVLISGRAARARGGGPARRGRARPVAA